MRLSIRVDGLAARLRDAVETASAAGFALIDLGIRGEFRPDSFAASARRDFRNSLARRGMGAGALHAELSMPLSDAESNNFNVPFLGRCMELVRDVGGGTLVARLGPLGERDSPEWRAAAEALSDLEAPCSAFGVELALQAGNAPASVAELTRGYSEAWVKCAVDTAAALRGGADPASEVSALAGRLAQVSARDVRDGETAEFGLGEVDWPGIVGALLAVEYAGILTVCPKGHSIGELTRSRVLLGAFG